LEGRRAGGALPWDPATYDKVVRLRNARLQAFPTPGRAPQPPRLATLTDPSPEALTQALVALAYPLGRPGPGDSGRALGSLRTRPGGDASARPPKALVPLPPLPRSGSRGAGPEAGGCRPGEGGAPKDPMRDPDAILARASLKDLQRAFAARVRAHGFIHPEGAPWTAEERARLDGVLEEVLRELFERPEGFRGPDASETPADPMPFPQAWPPHGVPPEDRAPDRGDPFFPPDTPARERATLAWLKGRVRSAWALVMRERRQPVSPPVSGPRGSDPKASGSKGPSSRDPEG